jgi:hypothetical protein
MVNAQLVAACSPWLGRWTRRAALQSIVAAPFGLALALNGRPNLGVRDAR